jgi:hypothetical protein
MTNKTKQKKLKASEMRDTSTGQLKNKAIDPYYIEAYLENPKLSQHDVLKLAMQEAGIEGNATRQFANLVHDRNRAQINEGIVKLASDLKNLSISVIKDLMINSESDSVRLSAAQTGTKDLFPNVSIKKEQTIDSIDDEIEQLQKEINEQEGVRH